jgi:UMF1 family MFS transporter
MEKNNPKTLWAWCMYDWANSTYSLTVTSAIFPLYFLSIAVNSVGEGKISFLGWENMPNGAVYAYLYSFSALLIAVLNPMIGSIADATGKHKTFMRFFCYLGVACCFSLFFAKTEYLSFTMLVFMVSSVAYSCSIVFCNSLLPMIASPDKFEEVSARGFTLGYIGGVLMLALNLLMIQMPALFGFSSVDVQASLPIRVSFVLVGLWWWVFAEYAFYFLPNRNTDLPASPIQENVFTRGYTELLKTGKALWQMPSLRVFMFSFFFYNMGLMTIMGLASVFGKEEIKLPSEDLILIILLLQIVGALGAWSFGILSKRIGNLPTLQMGVICWIFICVYAYTVTTRTQFYVLAMSVGLVMGGLQALSRAGFALLLPKDNTDNASFFGFYDTMNQIGTVLGTFLYGFIHFYTGSMRNSILFLASFFLVGLIGLYMLRRVLKATY